MCWGCNIVPYTWLWRPSRLHRPAWGTPDFAQLLVDFLSLDMPWADVPVLREQAVASLKLHVVRGVVAAPEAARIAAECPAAVPKHPYEAAYAWLAAHPDAIEPPFDADARTRARRQPEWRASWDFNERWWALRKQASTDDAGKGTA